MKLSIRSLIATLLVFASYATTASAFGDYDLNSGICVENAGQIPSVPDTGPTAMLLAFGLIGLAVAAKKRFKRD